MPFISPSAGVCRRGAFLRDLIVASFLCLNTAARAEPLRWESGPGFRSVKINLSPDGKTGFTQMTNAQLGLHFTNILTFQKAALNQNLLNGAGVAAGDFDGDGWCDLYFCGLGGRNALYRNLGNWRFEDVTDAAGVACTNQLSTGAVFADINGDGHVDLLVTSCGGPNACFLNDGHGHFQNVTEAAGLLSKYGSTTMALADIDGDGDLDLYVANYGENTIRSGLNLTTRVVNGKETVTGRYANRIKIINGRLVEFGEPDALYLNDGKGKFTPVSWTDGTFLDAHGHPLRAPLGDMGLSVQFRDLNGDGAPDIYVCNDFHTPDRIWINDGHGRFRALSNDALSHTSQFSMSMDAADIDRDGQLDIFVADMARRSHRDRMRQMAPAEIVFFPGEMAERPQARRNTLFLNRGDGTWIDVANYAGLGATDWTWSGVFLDVDLDGFQDLLIANGNVYDTEDQDATEVTKALGKQRPQNSRTNLMLFPKLEVANAVFRNRGNLTFEDVSPAWAFNSRQVSHGIALADLDNDGDLDVAVNCLNAPPLIYRNDTSAARVAVRLKGRAPNNQGIGAQIDLRGGPVLQSEEVICGGHYLSGSECMRVFATGKSNGGMTLTIAWRGGHQSTITNVIPNRIYEVDESASVTAVAPAKAAGARGADRPPLFEDVSPLLLAAAQEEAFRDISNPPLWPRKSDPAGTFVAWLSGETKAHESLLVLDRTHSLELFQFDGAKFERRSLKPPNFLPGALAVCNASGKESMKWIVGVPQGAESKSALLQFDFSGLLPTAPMPAPDAIPIPDTNPSVLASADFDADGDLDLFVGSHGRPGRYPEPTRALLFRSENGQLRIDEANTARLAKAGLVNGAVFSDLDGDGWPELILACEWGPIRVFRNRAGQLSEATAELGLAEFTGWWQGVTTGDFDGDGRLDIVASNWGLNSAYKATPASPVFLYYGDLAGAGAVEWVEAEFDPEQNKIVPRRSLPDLSHTLPFLRSRFSSHRAYGQASVGEILGDAFAKAKELKATTLGSMVFLNRGDHFEPRLLPAQAQWAPAFGVCVADFDGDGKEDIFLAQNCSGAEPYTLPLREGRGLLLSGQGNGDFVAMTSQDSGIKITGDQDGAAVGDFDGDGRPDLAVVRSAAGLKLFRNAAGKPGLRIRLVGPVHNPSGIGCVVRAGTADTFGPAREVHAGSGYASQDSLVPVLGAVDKEKKIWVRWPGGKITEAAVPPGARTVEVRFQNE